MKLNEQSVRRLAHFLPIPHYSEKKDISELTDRVHVMGGILHRVWGKEYRRIFYTEVLTRMGLKGTPLKIGRWVWMHYPIDVPKGDYLSKFEKFMPDGEYFAMIGRAPDDKHGFSLGVGNTMVGFYSNDESPLTKLLRDSTIEEEDGSR